MLTIRARHLFLYTGFTKFTRFGRKTCINPLYCNTRQVHTDRKNIVSSNMRKQGDNYEWRSNLCNVSLGIAIGTISGLGLLNLKIKAADKEDEFTSCYCRSFHCQGKQVSKRTENRHATADKELPSQSEEGRIIDDNLYDRGIAVQPLYEGSSTTVLQTLASHFIQFTYHPSMSKIALSQRLNNDHKTVLPKPNNLPDSYEHALSLIKPYLVKQVHHHVCPKDCYLYKSPVEEACPSCGSSRYTGTLSKKPRRSFRHMPLKQRLIRLYDTSNLAKIVQAAHLPSSTVHDIHDTNEWSSWFSANGVFAGDSRGLVLGLSTDGVDPFKHHSSKSYSMWPIVLYICNLPREVRFKPGMLLLWGIVKPSENGGEPNLDIYMQLLVDELIELTEFRAFDAYRNAPFNLKVRLLRFILDFPALSKVFHMQNSGGYRACHWCHMEGERCPNVQKMIYLKNRSYLEHDCPLRLDKTYFNQKEDKTKKPSKMNKTDSLKYRLEYISAKTKSQKTNVAKKSGVKGLYPMLQIPYHDIHEQSIPDPMHTLKDINENILNLITGKSKSGLQDVDKAVVARKKKRGRQKRARIDAQHPHHHAWLLDPEDISIANARALSLKVPDGFDMEPGEYFTKTSNLINSHAHKQFATQSVLQFCLRGLLDSKQRATLFNFYGQLSALFAESIDLDQYSILEDKINIALALLERDFPVALHNITTHILRHIPENLNRFGTVYSTWMYPLERYNSWLTRRVMSRSNPEATIMETYAIHDWCTYMIVSGRVQAPAMENKRVTDVFSTYNVILKGQTSENERDTNVKSHTKTTLLSDSDIKVIAAEYSSIFKTVVDIESIESSVQQRPVLQKCESNPLRWIKYGSIQSEKCGSKDSSSVISMKINGTPRFGKIKFMFIHTFREKSFKWAMINWFAPAKLDVESQILNAGEDIVLTSPAPLDKLSRPLLYSIENEHIWFINYQSNFEKSYFEPGHMLLGMNNL